MYGNGCFFEPFESFVTNNATLHIDSRLIPYYYEYIENFWFEKINPFTRIIYILNCSNNSLRCYFRYKVRKHILFTSLTLHEGITIFPICNDAASATWMKKTDLRIGGGGPHYKLRNFAKNPNDPAGRQVLMTVLAKTSPSLFDLAAGTIYNSLHCKLTPTNLWNSLEDILPDSVIDK